MKSNLFGLRRKKEETLRRAVEAWEDRYRTHPAIDTFVASAKELCKWMRSLSDYCTKKYPNIPELSCRTSPTVFSAGAFVDREMACWTFYCDTDLQKPKTVAQCIALASVIAEALRKKVPGSAVTLGKEFPMKSSVTNYTDLKIPVYLKIDLPAE